jgi:HAD superfamily hydrolase (TIGR01490 family)
VNQRIAFFDFDGTITTKDTLLEFIKFSKGPFRFYLGFLLNSPWLVAYRLKIISNQAAKERILTWFFRNQPLPAFQQLCDEFAATILPGLIRPKALREIALLQEKGATVVIVSASPENWISAWTTRNQTSLLATRLELTPAAPPRLTGRILDRNCHGEEKVSRIREAYPLADYNEIYAYGDTKGDKPMLNLGTASFYKPFR